MPRKTGCLPSTSQGGHAGCSPPLHAPAPLVPKPRAKARSTSATGCRNDTPLRPSHSQPGLSRADKGTSRCGRRVRRGGFRKRLDALDPTGARDTHLRTRTHMHAHTHTHTRVHGIQTHVVMYSEDLRLSPTDKSSPSCQHTYHDEAIRPPPYLTLVRAFAFACTSICAHYNERHVHVSPYGETTR